MGGVIDQAIQGDVLCKIEDFSVKNKFVTEVEVPDETVPSGQSAAENLYITNPEIQVFLTPDSPIATGINNYYTSMNSPVTDYSGMGIFTINGNTADEYITTGTVSSVSEADFQ